jgi:hypothetical protein
MRPARLLATRQSDSLKFGMSLGCAYLLGLLTPILIVVASKLRKGMRRG